MTQTWFTADHHFGHHKIIAMCRRPFSDADEMNEELISRWNDTVAPQDIVWHLGDFAYKSPRHPGDILLRLNGTKHLVRGNHDRARTTACYGWASVQSAADISHEGQRLYLSHYPHLEWPGYWRQSLHLFGHVHGNRRGVGRSCDVGVDCWGYRPVSLPEILRKLDGAVNA